MRTHALRLLFLLLTTASIVKGQSITGSPYSGFGIGELHYPGLAYNTGLGFAGIALDSNQHVNVLNPAALSSVHLATFEGSLLSRSVYYEDSRSSSFRNNTSLDHVVFGLPIRQKAAISFGLLPYSGLGSYDSDTLAIPGFGSINFVSEDSGGVNKAFFGFGFGVKKFSFGVEGAYLFGNVNRQRDLVILDDPKALNVTRLSETRVGGVVAKLGLHYRTKIGKSKMAVGLTYSPRMKVSSYSTLITRTFETNAGARVNVKQVERVSDIPGSIYIPSSAGIGFALYRTKLTVAMDFQMTKWSEFRPFEARDTILENGEAFFSGSESLVDSWRAGGGVQYIPDPDPLNTKFLTRSKYKAGAYYAHTGLKINGVDIPEYGLTLGWSMPMRRLIFASPAIEANIAIGERGSLTGGLVRERFITARIGVTITDRWFIARKFD